MIGTLVNVGTVILGSAIGLLLKNKLPKKLVTIVFQAIGLFTIILGVTMALKGQNFLLIVFSLILGSLLGEWIDLDKYINIFSNKIKTKINSNNDKFADGLVTAFLLYCMGSMTILGAFEEGLGNKPDLLITKSVMDGFSSIALASALGLGVMFSVIPLLIYQGGLTLFAVYLQESLTQVYIDEITAVGGILLIGLGINILEIKNLRILNMIPALLVIVPLIYFFG
jgi:uncharacterized protein